MRHQFFALAVAAFSAPAALAQNLDLDKRGGALGSHVTLSLQGQPNELYALVVDLVEQPTFLPWLGVTMDVSDQFAWLTYHVPGFFGATDGSGAATASVLIPNDPALDPETFSIQAVAGNGPFRVSNLVRITPQPAGSFEPALETAPLPILAGDAIAQPSGELLFVGGSGPVAQRYASRTEQWSLGGATFGVGLLSQTTALADGRVLFTGGIDATTGQPTAAAAVYDPTTQTTSNLTMASARAGHGASLLNDGRVLISGGLPTLDLNNPLATLTSALNSTELFDPATDSFVAGPNMLEGRALHTATTLTTGQVLVAGGLSVLPIVNVPTVSSTAYLYSPGSNAFGLPAVFPGARMLHSAVALDNGRVLLCGGLSLDLTTFLQTGNPADLVVGTRDDCLVYAPGFLFGTFTQVPGMQVGRAGAALAPLPNGGALIAGGFELALDIPNNNLVLQATATADVFAQGPYTITATGSMAAPRSFATAHPLVDGTVLLVGGGSAAEIYQR